MRIMSLDGGGIRGILTAKLLQRLPELDFDLYAGTSTGGFIALGLAAGFKPSDFINFYYTNGPKVFEKTGLIQKITSGIFVSQYDGRILRGVLKEIFGTLRLGDLERHVLIPSFDLDTQYGFIRTWKPKFFTTFDEKDHDQLLVDVAMRTSAAPTYFPVYQGYVDGGVVANNPSMCALAQGLNEGWNLKDIGLLSISTGRTTNYIDILNTDWGITKWISRITTMMMEGMVDIADYQCDRLLGDRYHRLDIALNKRVGLDDVDRMDYLLRTAEEADLSSTERFMTETLWALGFNE